MASCHDLSEGGLLVAAAEMAFAGELGLELDLRQVPCAPLDAGHDPQAVRLFSESCTRWLVEVEQVHAAAFEACFADLDLARVGLVGSAARLVVRGLRGEVALDLEVEALRRAHQGGFQG